MIPSNPDARAAEAEQAQLTREVELIATSGPIRIVHRLGSSYLVMTCGAHRSMVLDPGQIPDMRAALTAMATALASGAASLTRREDAPTGGATLTLVASLTRGGTV